MSKRKEISHTVNEVIFISGDMYDDLFDQMIQIIYHEDGKERVMRKLFWRDSRVYRVLSKGDLRKYAIVVEEKIIKFDDPSPDFQTVLSESTKLGIDLSKIDLIYNQVKATTDTESVSRIYYLKYNNDNNNKTDDDDDDETIQDVQGHLLKKLADIDMLRRRSRCRQLVVYDQTKRVYINGISVGTLNEGKKDMIAKLPMLYNFRNTLSDGEDRKVLDLPSDWLQNNQPIGTYLTFHPITCSVIFRPCMEDIMSQLPQSIFNIDPTTQHQKQFLIRVEPYHDNIQSTAVGDYHIGFIMVYEDTLR